MRSVKEQLQTQPSSPPSPHGSVSVEISTVQASGERGSHRPPTADPPQLADGEFPGECYAGWPLTFRQTLLSRPSIPDECGAHLQASVDMPLLEKVRRPYLWAQELPVHYQPSAGADVHRDLLDRQPSNRQRSVECHTTVRKQSRRPRIVVRRPEVHANQRTPVMRSAEVAAVSLRDGLASIYTVPFPVIRPLLGRDRGGQQESCEGEFH